MKKLVIFFSLLFSISALALPQPIFQLRGTQLKPYYTSGDSTYHTVVSSANAQMALAPLASTGVFGGSVIDFHTTTGSRIAEYSGGNNWPAAKGCSFLSRIVPLWTGLPATIQNLVVGIGGSGVTTLTPSSITASITAAGKIFFDASDQYSADNYATSTVPLTFTSGVPTTIVITWDGLSTEKIYQDRALIETVTLAGSFSGTWSNLDVQSIMIGESVNGGSSTEVNYYLNEFDVFSTAIDGTATSTTGFTASLNQNADTNSDPGIANVLSPVSYAIKGAPLVGSYVPAPAPSASDLRKGTVVGSITGTLAVPSTSSVLSGVSTDNTVGNYITVASSVIESGQTFGPSGTLTGSLLSTNPGAANVAFGVNYSINSASYTGTLVNECTDPGVSRVELGTTYLVNGAFYTGTGTCSDRWSDPGFASVSNGVTYLANGITKTGTLNSVTVNLEEAFLTGKPLQSTLSPNIYVTQGDAGQMTLQAFSAPSVPMDLTGSTLTTYVPAQDGSIVTLSSGQHTLTNPTQGTFSITFNAVQSLLFKATPAGTPASEIVTVMVQNGNTIAFHGLNALHVDRPYPRH